MHSNYQTQYSNNLQHNQPNNQQNSFQNNPNQDSFKEQIIAGLKSGKGLTGKDGIFSGMVKEVLETMLAEELNQHLTGERKNLGNDFDNRRNGYNSKTIKTKEFVGFSWVQGIDYYDHLNYWKFGYSALMITDTSFFRNPNYHQPTDTMETLDLNRMSKVIDAVFLALHSY